MRRARDLTYEEALKRNRSVVSGETRDTVKDSERRNRATFLALLESGSLDYHGNRYICIENGVLHRMSCETSQDLLTLMPGIYPGCKIFHVPLYEDIDKETYAIPGEMILGRRRRKHNLTEYWD